MLEPAAHASICRKEVTRVTLTRKDLGATFLTFMVLLTFAAAHQGWNVWLVGDSYRWAAVVISVLGVATCAMGSPGTGSAPKLLASLRVLALVLSVLAIVTGSLTILSLLVLDIVVLWAASTIGHVLHPPGTPIAT
jgi:hypothetical protein